MHKPYFSCPTCILKRLDTGIQNCNEDRISQKELSLREKYYGIKTFIYLIQYLA